MSARGRITVIDLDHERLSFVSGTVAPGRVRVLRRGSAARPAGLDVGSADALGAWVGERLREAGVEAAGRVLVCVPRGNVVMKRLAFPGLESHADPDLVAMVRLQMTRQMPMKVEGTAIDFVPLERVDGVGALVGATATAARSNGRASRNGEPHANGDGSGNGHANGNGTGNGHGSVDGPGVEVLACALPGDRVTWCRGVAEAAGVKLAHLSLRASGAATLLAQAGHGVEAPVLGVSIGWSSVEFVVVREGEIVFVRSADVPLTEDVDAAEYAQRVAIEARRTWMAYRVSPGSSEVAAVVAVGGGEVSRAVAARCGEALEIDSATVELPGFVEDDSVATAGDDPAQGGAHRSSRSPAGDAALAPLVGLMVAQASDRPVFDFAHPRQAPDTRAGTRRFALLGVLGLIVVIGGGVVLADMRVRGTRADARQAETDAREWGSRLSQHLRDDARLRHIEQWLAADVDWVAHWSKVNQTMPAPPEALMDSFAGNLTRADVVFEPGGSGSNRTYSPTKWRLDMVAVLHATGQLASRVVGNQFRERLVSDPTYVVESRGADTESRFDMDLVTRLGAPREPLATEPAVPAAPGGGAHAAEGGREAEGVTMAAAEGAGRDGVEVAPEATSTTSESQAAKRAGEGGPGVSP